MAYTAPWPCPLTRSRMWSHRAGISGTVKLALLDTGSDQRIEIETTSGDVYLDVPGAIDLDYDTASGDMHGRLEQGGSGCPKVEIETTSGDLILGAFD